MKKPQKYIIVKTTLNVFTAVYYRGVLITSEGVFETFPFTTSPTQYFILSKHVNNMLRGINSMEKCYEN